jgi:hypothetical protein
MDGQHWMAHAQHFLRREAKWRLAFPKENPFAYFADHAGDVRLDVVRVLRMPWG